MRKKKKGKGCLLKFFFLFSKIRKFFEEPSVVTMSFFTRIQDCSRRKYSSDFHFREVRKEQEGSAYPFCMLFLLPSLCIDFSIVNISASPTVSFQ